MGAVHRSRAASRQARQGVAWIALGVVVAGIYVAAGPVAPELRQEQVRAGQSGSGYPPLSTPRPTRTANATWVASDLPGLDELALQYVRRDHKLAEPLTIVHRMDVFPEHAAQLGVEEEQVLDGSVPDAAIVVGGYHAGAPSYILVVYDRSEGFAYLKVGPAEDLGYLEYKLGTPVP